MSGPRKRRWLDVLRRAAEPADADDASANVDTALWSAHGEAQRTVTEAQERAAHVTDMITSQRSAIEGVHERAGAMAAHVEGLTLAATRVVDTFERLSIIALNAGLEGARVAEPAGKALLLLSEEIRAHVERGAETTRDLAMVVEEIAAEASLIQGQVREALDAQDSTGREANMLGDALRRNGLALADVERNLRRVTGVDPEVARSIAVAAEHARGLLTALSALRAATPARPLLLGALRPVLAPLSRLLGELVSDGHDDEPASSSPTGDGAGNPP